MKLTFALLAGLLSFNAHAMKFSNQFIEFELPENWSCHQGVAEWICESGDKLKKNDAIIVMAAKMKGEQDSMDQYQSYLGKSLPYKKPNGTQGTSTPKYTAPKQFGGQPWIDSLHLESEVFGYYTRYLATVKEDIGVLVTYSIDKLKYEQYVAQFEKMVSTMKVFRKKGLAAELAAANAKASLFNKAKVPTDFIPATFEDPSATPKPEIKKAEAPKQAEDNTAIILLAAAMAAGAFLYYRKKR